MLENKDTFQQQLSTTLRETSIEEFLENTKWICSAVALTGHNSQH